MSVRERERERHKEREHVCGRDSLFCERETKHLCARERGCMCKRHIMCLQERACVCAKEARQEGKTKEMIYQRLQNAKMFYEMIY